MSKKNMQCNFVLFMCLKTFSNSNSKNIFQNYKNDFEQRITMHKQNKAVSAAPSSARLRPVKNRRTAGGPINRHQQERLLLGNSIAPGSAQQRHLLDLKTVRSWFKNQRTVLRRRIHTAALGSDGQEPGDSRAAGQAGCGRQPSVDELQPEVLDAFALRSVSE